MKPLRMPSVAMISRSPGADGQRSRRQAGAGDSPRRRPGCESPRDRRAGRRSAREQSTPRRSDAHPGHGGRSDVERGEAHHHPAGVADALVATLDEELDADRPRTPRASRSRPRRLRRLRPVPQPVDEGDEDAPRERNDRVQIARLAFEGGAGHGPSQDGMLARA